MNPQTQAREHRAPSAPPDEGRPPSAGARKGPSLASLRTAFRTIVWPRRRLLLLGLILVVVSRLCGLVIPGAPKFLIDEVIGAQNYAFLGPLILIVGVAATVQAVSSFALTRLLSVEAQHLISELRAQMQRHVIRLPIRYFDDHPSGAIVSRVMNDVEGVRNIVGTGLVQLIGGILTSVASFVILVLISAKLTLFALVPVVLFSIIAMKAFSYLRPIFRERGKINAEVTGRLTETLGGVRVVKGFNAESREEEVFRGGVERLFNNVKKTLTATSLVTSGATLLLGLSTMVIMFVGGRQVIGGSLSVGDLVSYVLYLAFLITPIMQMANIGTQITEAFAGLDRMDEILSLEREEDDTGRTVELGEIAGDIRFDDVYFAYEQEKEVLRGVSFHAPPGSITALVGSSGSGKSTIAGLAASFRTPDRGTVRIDGTDLSTVKLGSYRRQLGLVLQEDFLFDGSIRDNIAFARPDCREEDLLRAVEAAHVREFVDRFPDGLETLIGERGVKLSGGQKQRVAIARALLADPRVLILDEATSSLDMESESFIQESLHELMQGRTTLVIAHRLSTIRLADQILVIEGGEIVERGTHEELIEREGRYHDLYTYQARI